MQNCLKPNSKFLGISLILNVLLSFSAVTSVGAQTRSNSKTPYLYRIDDSALKHGEQQLLSMLADRPSMKAFVKNGVVKKGGPIWTKVIRLFAGELLHDRVYWCNKDCDNYEHYFAGHTWINKNCKIKLRSTINGREVDAEQLWSGLFYEFYNSAFRVERRAIHQSVLANQLTRKQYISACTNLEYKAATSTALFYRQVWFPTTQKLKVPSYPPFWHAPLRMTTPLYSYNKWLSQVSMNSGYPDDVFGKRWDCYYRQVGKKGPSR